MNEGGMLPGVQVQERNPEIPEPIQHRSDLDALGPGTADEDNHVPLSPEEQDKVDRAMFRTFYTPKNVREQVVLLQWQRLFAAWFAHLPVAPSIEDCVRYVRAITTFKVSASAIRELLHRNDFGQLVARFRESEQLRAKELLNADYQIYVDAHRRGLQMALDAEDYRAVPPFTAPMLDRVAPRKDDQVAKSPTIIINLGGVAQQEVLKLQIASPSQDDIVDADILEIEEA